MTTDARRQGFRQNRRSDFSRGFRKRGEPFAQIGPEPMTMCLAIPAFDENAGEYCLVTCADQRIENEIAGGDFALKLTPIGERWMTMGCGSATQIHRIVATLSRNLKGKAITNDNALEYVEGACLKHLKSWNDYRKVLGFREKWGCELIVGCFLDRAEPLLFRVDVKHRVHVEYIYACVGSGGAAGSTVIAKRFQDPELKRTNQDEVLTIREALYCLYEAKKMSEVQGSVGAGTDMVVLTRKAFRHVSPSGLETLDGWYREFGLRRFDGTLGLPTTFFSS